jgi:hypothetical protein
MKFLNFRVNHTDLLKKSGCIVLLVVLVTSKAKPQSKSDMRYTPLDSTVYGIDAPEGFSTKTFFWGTSVDYAIYEFSNILRANSRDKKELQRIEGGKQQTAAKLQIIKTQYLEYKKYPDSITDGWHSAIATDNINFCKDVKVFVKGNRVKKFVVDNYIPLNFLATREIKNAKNVISLNNFNGEQMNLVELYFIYDIDEPNIVQEPIKAGCVCFWSDIKNYEEIQLTLDGVRMENFKVRFNDEPGCLSNGMICRILKPGSYSFKAEGKGAIDWKKTIEIKENTCLKIRLGR